MKSFKGIPLQPLIISLLLHICLYLWTMTSPAPRFRNPQPIEVVYQNETNKKEGQQVVLSPENEALQNALKELKEKAKRLSEHTRRFKKEQVARQTGPTQNSINHPFENNSLQNTNTRTNPKPSQAKPNTEKQIAESRHAIPRPDIGASGDIAVSPLPLPGTAGREMRTGYSALSEFVPDVQQGGFTSLNTDQFVHYTFYARTNEQIRNRWVSLVRQFVNQNLTTEINRLAKKTQLTELEVILTPDGQFQNAILHQGAENRDLDEIAITAFRLAAPFNNPPSEMVQDDGLIHLHYGFYIQFSPRLMARGSR